MIAHKKKLNIFIKIGLSLVFIVTLLVISLWIYSSFSYEPSDEMYDYIDMLDMDQIVIEENTFSITYTNNQPLRHIIIIPGGLVSPDSYKFLASILALSNNNVTIVKPLFNLAILSPNQAARYIDEDLDNVIVGHSLGGVVASMVAAKHDDISTVILLGSYSTVDLTDKNVLLITASNDLVLDQENFDNSQINYNDQVEIVIIDGGNHAGFGFYGPQSSDGEATITTQTQQSLIQEKISLYLTRLLFE